MRVDLFDHSGSDRHIAAYFWTSTDKDSDAFECPESEVERILRFGMKAKPVPHATPFGHPVVTLHIGEIDLATGEQLLRHRTGNFSKKSYRYTRAARDGVYVPEVVNIRRQVGRPGHYTFEQIPPEEALQGIQRLLEAYDAAFTAYEELVEEYEWAGELARMVLPVGTHTRMYMTMSLRNWLNVFVARCDSHAQLEVRLVAEAIEPILNILYPITMHLWNENGRRIV